jgi:hypothetical protein
MATGLDDDVRRQGIFMRRGRIRHELLVAWVYAAIMAASALPTPLYTLYRPQQDGRSISSG